MAPDPHLQLWCTPMGMHRWAQAQEVNPLLVRVFRAMRATDSEACSGAAFYASRDDLFLAVVDAHLKPVSADFRPGAPLRTQMRILGLAVAAEGLHQHRGIGAGIVMFGLVSDEEDADGAMPVR